MTFRDALNQAKEALKTSGIEDPDIESVLLLTYALNIGRVELYQDFDKQLSPERSQRFWELAQRRINGEPSAYILGHKEFYGLDFVVNPSVLIPRPETELLVEKAIELICADTPANAHPELSRRTIADIGTGSGAIAVSLAFKLPYAKIYASDISPAALKVALTNCKKHEVEDKITLLEGDLLESLPEPVDMIIANLPYVTTADLTEVNTLGFEPRLALDGGLDGLDLIRRLVHQLQGKLKPKGTLLLEIGQGQRKAVIAFLRKLYPSATVESFADLAGIERVALIKIP